MRRTVCILLSCLALGACSGSSSYERGLDAYHRQDYQEAFRRMQQEALLGNPDAAYYLGVLYSRGLGVQESSIEAERWFRKAFDSYVISAAAGDVRSQSRLCFMFFSGRGVPQNYAEAHRWCEKAAQLGDATAQRNLSVMYEQGYGVPKDPEKARYWHSQFLESSK